MAPSSPCCCCCCCCCSFPSKLFPSLALLTSPADYVVTTNHGALWQKHVAWSKPDGAQLKQYCTCHYASIMILLSLLLTASITVFFHSSAELVEMRSILLGGNNRHQEHPDQWWKQVKFWTGLLVLLDIFVTLLGLVTTFTLWCMIAAISDVNAHCVLRSSLGQYAISLPPRLVVTSLYIFLLWTLLFVVELVVWPLAWILVTTVVLFFFLAVIIPLSALGRVILHTGAMAQRPIFPSTLETQLLPTGLYSSLLLRATHRQRRNPNDVARQYRNHQHHHHQHHHIHNATRTAADTTADRAKPLSHQEGHDEEDVPTSDQEPSYNIAQVDATLINSNKLPRRNSRNEQHAPTRSETHRRPVPETQHYRRPSEFPLPHASVLNAAISGQELSELIESTLLSSSSTAEPSNNGHGNQSGEEGRASRRCKWQFRN